MTSGRFRQSLSSGDLAHLQALLDGAVAPKPVDAWRFFLGADPLGWVQSQHVPFLLRALPGVGSVPGGLCWDVHKRSPAQRSQDLALAAIALRDQGLIRGWRDECYSYWGAISHDPDVAQPEWFRLERAAFRFFGLRSHAVHVNGFTEDGFVWCGRRSLTKPTDPGMLDNIAAGGLPVGESLQLCGVREMAEEAGLSEALALTAVANGQVTTCRSVTRGWHHETLWVYNLVVPADVQPVNQDGEVAEFTLLSPQQVVQAIAAKTMTVDASCVIAHAVLSPGA